MSAGPAPQLDARLVPAAFAAWAVTLAGLWTGPAVTLTLGVSATGIALLALGFRIPSDRHVRVGLVVLVVAAGFSGAITIRMWSAQTHPLAEWEAGTRVTVVAAPTDDPRPVRSGFDGAPRVRLPVALHHVGRGPESMSVGGRAVVFAPADGWSELLPGQQITMRARVHPASGSGTDVAILRVEGAPRAIAEPPPWQRWAGTIRDRFAAACASALTPAAAGLLPGLVVGDTRGLADDVREDFRVAGLAHLTAVSGANVSIVLGAVLLLVRGAGVGPRTGAVLAAIALVAFVIVVRPTPSVVRAAAMGSVALLALVAGRERAALPALAASVGVLLLIWPDLAADVGFALSVVATGALVIVAPVWVQRLRARRWPRAVAETCAMSLAAYVVTAPVVAAATGTVSLVAVAANILVAPVVAPLAVLGSFVSVLAAVWPAAAEIAARGAAPMLWWMLTVADRAADLPSAEVSVPQGVPGASLVLAVTVAGWWVTRSAGARRFGAIVAAVGLVVWLTVRAVLPSWPGPEWVLVACDVGQGDALVFSAGAGRAVVVDTGTEERSVDRCLRRLGIGEVPHVVLTHLHADHAGGLADVLRGRNVGEIVVGAAASAGGTAPLDPAAGSGVPVREARAGDVIVAGRSTLRVIGPPESTWVTTENDGSLIVLADTAVGTVLVAGDAEAPGLDALLRSGVDVRADVLVVPHHGSRTTPERFVTAVGPRVAVISVGADNPYGHPHPDVVAALDGSGVRVLRTDVDGDVAVVRSGGGALAVVTDR